MLSLFDEEARRRALEPANAVTELRIAVPSVFILLSETAIRVKVACVSVHLHGYFSGA